MFDMSFFDRQIIYMCKLMFAMLCRYDDCSQTPHQVLLDILWLNHVTIDYCVRATDDRRGLMLPIDVGGHENSQRPISHLSRRSRSIACASSHVYAFGELSGNSAREPELNRVM
jgi:hypothetical protein